MPGPKRLPDLAAVNEWPAEQPEPDLVHLTQQRLGGAVVGAYFWNGGLLWVEMINSTDVPPGARPLFVRSTDRG